MRGDALGSSRTRGLFCAAVLAWLSSPLPAMPTVIHKSWRLDKSDLVFEHSADPAFMAVLDMATYESFLPGWDWPSLTLKVASQMSQERIFAWGCPEFTLNVRITMTSPGHSSFHPVESVSGFLVTSGQLCFTSYENIGYCAQFEDKHFPLHEDHPLLVNPGRYQIEVHRMFQWRHGQQFPEFADAIGDGDHFVIVLTPAGDSMPPKHFDCVPWVVLR